ncbi:MAG: hypothetical protein UT24_C0008G0021 [Candidatus Woesebacteria bacterium GW2011_GWB1_39_12]|uniref:Nucleoside 2-deoxyribosyltransferase n=2 Tax=Candidatus Woeseibacteriota TaxID=1752722 RepID=A0A0G0PH69_9BACT|nr:MAG: hypothetical protein UT23_C0012G0079 [Candidatus Woesebacteria bacterium GW2011_GWA1_39_12]KKR00893.1 MAG: hypothetical protein UT24_C0008G0021 [Candidatus Woesebacteria bacterium GW2011_GWB1_39_12]
MKIFYTVSYSAWIKHKDFFKVVLDELERHKAKVETTIRRDHYRAELKKIKDSTSPSEDKYRYENDRGVRQSIFRADAVVIEASYPSFRLGFEAFYALTQNKPVLVLSKFRNYSKLIDQPHFFGAKYTKFTLPDEIAKFIRHVEYHKLRNRFNLFISDSHKEHLEKSGKHFSVSMSDYIRKLVEADMERK